MLHLWGSIPKLAVYSQSVAESAVSSAPENIIQETVEEVTTVWANLWAWFLQIWPKALWCGIIFIAGWSLSSVIIKLMRKGLKRTEIERSVVTFLCSISKYLLRFVVVILALTPFGFQITSIFAALGAAGLGLGLGLKESISNLASGIQVIITKPLKVGDYIELGAVEGTVLRVEMMFTTLKTLDNKEVVIPNSQLTASIMTNYTSLGVRRVDFNYWVRYGTDLEHVKRVMLEEGMADELTLKEPKPLVAILEQGANGIRVSMRLYCKPEDYWVLFFRMQEKIKVLFEKENIQIPFNQLDIHIREDNTVGSLLLPPPSAGAQPQQNQSSSLDPSLEALAKTVASAAAAAASEAAVKAIVEAKSALQNKEQEASLDDISSKSE